MHFLPGDVICIIYEYDPSNPPPLITEEPKKELKRLANKPDSEINFSDIPEVLDWNKAIRGGRFHQDKRGRQRCNDIGSLFAYQPSMNENPICPKCGVPEVVKNGKARGKQRFKCKECNFQFTSLVARGYPMKTRARVNKLYNHGLSIRAAAKLEGASITSLLLNWIKELAKKYMKNLLQPPLF